MARTAFELDESQLGSEIEEAARNSGKAGSQESDRCEVYVNCGDPQLTEYAEDSRIFGNERRTGPDSTTKHFIILAGKKEEESGADEGDQTDDHDRRSRRSRR